MVKDAGQKEKKPKKEDKPPFDRLEHHIGLLAEDPKYGMQPNLNSR